jgi:galactofuranosylgalactofuranosylrhamnosyl-N-acetylglucosaminyl-diphospho-decaprenol beta-1,5/1,6-galactofuranosyltransferase
MIFDRLNKNETRSLYFRGGGSVESQQILLQSGETVSFDTYYNGFFYSKYLTYTQVRSMTAMIEVSGTCRVELMVTDPKNNSTMLEAQENSGPPNSLTFRNIDLSKLPAEGMLYFRVTGISDRSAVCGGHWAADVPAEQAVTLALVICTYLREEYVKQNIRLLQQTILAEMKGVELFVIDNGRTLGHEEKGRLHILPNRNYGGSGGFTRGIMEASKRGFTHVLLMDDDIRFEPETIYRTIQLFKVAKPQKRPLMIGGAMLVEDRPTMQFESGAFFENGRLRPVGQNLDLTKVESLLENNKEQHVQYNAWWYCCFPVSIAEQAGLPLPFFIKSDDVEYGLRAKADILLLNGIGVWHADFSTKYSPHLEYYIKRNELVVSALHKEGDSGGKAAWKILRASSKALLQGEPSTVRFLLRAAKDFMEGPAFFEGTDEEILNRELVAMKTAPFIRSRLLAILAYPFLVAPVIIPLFLRYKATQRLYLEQVDKITSFAFWREHLGMPE